MVLSYFQRRALSRKDKGGGWNLNSEPPFSPRFWQRTKGSPLTNVFVVKFRDFFFFCPTLNKTETGSSKR